MVRALIAAALAVAATLAQTSDFPTTGRPASPLEYAEQPFDVLRYDATLDFTDAPAVTMSGVCAATILRKTDAPFSYFFHLRDLDVDSCLLDGERVEATPRGDESDPDFHYALPLPAADADTAEIVVYYSGAMTDEGKPAPWGGVHSGKGNLFSLGVGFFADYVSCARHWLPCHDHPADKAAYRARFIVADPYVAVSNGASSVERTDDGAIYEYRMDEPCATYLLAFAIDEYVPVRFEGARLPITVYAAPDDSAAAAETFKLAPLAFAEFERRYGDYPFETCGFVLTGLGSMEHQTMVSMDVEYVRSIWNAGDTVNAVAMHELAHQWFGDMVTCRHFGEAWLNEGFAEYNECVWEETLFGREAYLDALQEKIDDYLKFARREGVLPLRNYPRELPSSNYPYTIYYKGAVVVGMLRHELGDSLFHAGVRDYLERNAYATATTSLLRESFERTSGRDLRWFFDQWVERAGYPIVEAAVDQRKTESGSIEATATLRQTQPDEFGVYRGLPVEIELTDENGATTHTIVTLDAAEETFAISLDAAVVEATINEGPTTRTLLKIADVTVNPLQ
jgi:aminopeptidase N